MAPSRRISTGTVVPGAVSATASLRWRLSVTVLAVEFDNDVAVLEAGFGGRAVGHDVADERALVVLEVELLGQRGGDVLDHDAEVAAGDVAVAR